MTITIGVAVPEGIVIGADSRTTYGNARGWPKVGSDYAHKVFQLGRRSAASTFGWAWLNQRNIASLIEDFKRSADIWEEEPRPLAEKLGQFFDDQYNVHVKAGHDKAVARGRAVGFIVAGFDSVGTGRLLRALVPGPVVQEFYGTDSCGAVWDGQTDIVTRLIKGSDGRFNVDVLPSEAREALDKMEYITYFNRFTLQDAIDYAIFLMKATTEMQRFSDGIAAVPGDIAGTGGPIDIALVSAEGFNWIQRKQLRGEREASVRGPGPFAGSSA